MSATPRRLRRVGIELYTLRDDARRDLERTLVNIAQIGYKDVELLSSMNNFGMPPAQLRAVLDRNGLRAPSTHLSGESFDDPLFIIGADQFTDFLSWKDPDAVLERARRRSAAARSR